MIAAKTSISLFTKFVKVNIVLVLALFTFNSNAQAPPLDPIVYISFYGEEAVSQMITYKIPASVILAQAIFESNSGNSILAKKSNNHFGIKCHASWGGDTIVKSDDTLNECFRKYNTVEDSYSDHSKFLRSRSRYSQLFELPLSDYKSWCKGLKSSGYATYSGYATALIEIIEDYKLYEFDRAERIEIVNYSGNQELNIRPCYFCMDDISLSDLVKTNALFLEEKEALIQCLDLIIEEEITDIAENYKYCSPKNLYGAHNV